LVAFLDQPGPHHPARSALARLNARNTLLFGYLHHHSPAAAVVWLPALASDLNTGYAGTVFGCLRQTCSGYQFTCGMLTTSYFIRFATI